MQESSDWVAVLVQSLMAIVSGWSISIETIALVVTVLLAAASYVVTYSNNLRLARRAEYLALITKQINELYGPLYVITKTSQILFRALHARLVQNGLRYVNEDAPQRVGEFSRWQVWLEEVLIPLNVKLETVLVEKAHLIREQEMPECLLLFAAHSAGYRALIQEWRRGVFEQSTSIIKYPEDVLDYAEKSYKDLKTEQLRLVARTTKHS